MKTSVITIPLVTLSNMEKLCIFQRARKPLAGGSKKCTQLHLKSEIIPDPKKLIAFHSVPAAESVTQSAISLILTRLSPIPTAAILFALSSRKDLIHFNYVQRVESCENKNHFFAIKFKLFEFTPQIRNLIDSFLNKAASNNAGVITDVKRLMLLSKMISKHFPAHSHVDFIFDLLTLNIRYQFE